jgi:hypothetical protein
MKAINNDCRKRQVALVILLAAVFITSTDLATASPAGFDKDDKKEKKAKKSKKGAESTLAPQTAGKPQLWQSRNISSLNLYWGMGSEERAPKPPFTFEKEDITGTNPKIKVTDANGIRWNVKFDDEVNSEVASARLVWACGYMVEESYFVRSGKVAGVKSLDRAKKFVGADGAFTNAMFERRPDDIARRNIRWSWESNPFVGTKELSGLAILVAMLNNYDAKIENNNVLGMYGEDKSSVNEWYILSDWGASFGKTGGVFSQSKWDLKDFASQAFIDGVSGNSLKLHYSGKMGRSMRTVPVEHAKWFAGVVGQLSDEQLRDAFRAAGATDEEVNGFAARLRQKINELKAATGQ